jgi:hypothetical protein
MLGGCGVWTADGGSMDSQTDRSVSLESQFFHALGISKTTNIFFFFLGAG